MLYRLFELLVINLLIKIRASVQGLIMLLLGSIIFSSCLVGRSIERPPNIVLIMADDMSTIASLE